MKRLDRTEMIPFWRGKGKYGKFSNFYMEEMNHDGLTFHSSEQAVMYRKAKLFNSEEIAKEILKTKYPDEAKKLGRSRKIKFKEDVWKKNRERIYEEVLYDKFKSGENRRLLLSTGDKILVEASPYDRIWGVGLDEDNPNIYYPSNWKGLNLLGKVLMNVREQLKQT